MKTVLQELIEELEKDVDTLGLAHHIKVKYLPKEKQQIKQSIVDFHLKYLTDHDCMEHDYLSESDQLYLEQYFKDTYDES